MRAGVHATHRSCKPRSGVLVQGKDGSHATTWALKAAREILAESFDPIIDAVTARDMLAMMVLAQAAGPWDYTGMHVALLRHRVRARCSPLAARALPEPLETCKQPERSRFNRGTALRCTGACARPANTCPLCASLQHTRRAVFSNL